MLLRWMCLIGVPIKIRRSCIESSDPDVCFGGWVSDRGYLDMLKKYEEIGYMKNLSYRNMLTFYFKKKLRGWVYLGIPRHTGISWMTSWTPCWKWFLLEGVQLNNKQLSKKTADVNIPVDGWRLARWIARFQKSNSISTSKPEGGSFKSLWLLLSVTLFLFSNPPHS